mgnify:CR=1 FL=1
MNEENATIRIYSKREGAVVWGPEPHQRIEHERFYSVPVEVGKKLLADFPGQLVSADDLAAERRNPLSDVVKERDAKLAEQAKRVAELEQKLAALEQLTAASAAASVAKKRKE